MFSLSPDLVGPGTVEIAVHLSTFGRSVLFLRLFDVFSDASQWVVDIVRDRRLEAVLVGF